MARRQASFSVEDEVGKTSDELFRRTVALHSKLFVTSAAPTSLPAEVARAQPKSPVRKAATSTQAATATQPASAPPPAPTAAGQGQKRKRGQGGSSGGSAGNGGLCFLCGLPGHKKADCPQKNKGKAV